MSKASRIRELYAQGLGTAEIARSVGCNPAYVRVAGRQRKDGTDSPADTKWRTKVYGSMEAYYEENNARTRERRIAYYRDRRRNDPEYLAKCRGWDRARRARKRAAARGMEPEPRIV